jgi:hypothetical protein
MRRALALASTIALVALTGGSAAADSADNGTSSGKVLTLYATEATSVNLSAQGEEVGDEELPTAGARFVGVDTLYSDEDREDEVGRNDFVCTITEVSDEPTVDVVCSGVVRLDDSGSLAWSGATTFSEEEMSSDEPFIIVAITGGTEDFTGADGQVKIFDDGSTDDETLSRYEVDLSH